METPVVGRSILAGTFGECIAEFFGTFVLLLFGDGSVAAFALFNNVGPNNAPTSFANEWIIIGLGWGLAVMLGIYVAGAVSGAHINPAITIALAARGKFAWRKVIPYLVAQVIGAFIAAVVVFFVYRGAINHAVSLAGAGSTITSTAGGVFYTIPKPFVGLFGSFCTEFVGTALLVGLIFAITDAHNQPVQANLNPFIIGLVVVAIGLSFGLNTGYAINPARDFGPRLFLAIADGGRSLNSYTWIPIVAPILGGIAGGFIYDFTVGKTIEARRLGRSGDTITTGRTVREPSGD
jgi:glycerol uptake facilitator protein